MPVSHQPAIERIARVIAGQQLSANGNGADGSAGCEVDRAWPEYRSHAKAVLRTLREPDESMAEAGDTAIWRRMVEAALGESGKRPDDSIEIAAQGPAEGGNDVPSPLPGSPRG